MESSLCESSLRIDTIAFHIAVDMVDLIPPMWRGFGSVLDVIHGWSLLVLYRALRGFCLSPKTNKLDLICCNSIWCLISSICKTHYGRINPLTLGKCIIIIIIIIVIIIIIFKTSGYHYNVKLVASLKICYYSFNTDIINFCCSYLLTCGSDGDVRIYKDFDDSDPKSFRVGDHVTVLAVKVRT